MATKRLRTWFFDDVATPVGIRFNTYNKPTKGTFEDLLESIPVFLEATSTASLSTQGLVKLASLANSLSRTDNVPNTMQAVVLPSQLPMMLSGTAGAVEIGAGESDTYSGIKTIGITTAGKRLDYRIEFDPSEYPVIIPADYTGLVNSQTLIVIDSGIPKRILITDLVGSADQLWETDGTVINPTSTSLEILEIYNDFRIYKTGTASIYPTRTISGTKLAEPPAKTDGAGTILVVRGGHAIGETLANGGKLRLYGGYPVAGGVAGDTMIGYDGTTHVGKVGIRMATESAWDISIFGSVHLKGILNLDSSGGGTGTMDKIITINSDGDVLYSTNDELMYDITGVTDAHAIPYYDGNSWGKLDLTTTANKQYLTFSTGGVFGLEALDLSGLIVAGDLNAAFALPSTSVTVEAGTLDDYITNNDIDIAALESALESVESGVVSWAALTGNTILVVATMKNSYECDVTSGSTLQTLPLANTVPLNTRIEFTQNGANTATIQRAGTDVLLVYGVATASLETSTTVGGHGLTIIATTITNGEWLIKSM